MTSFGLMPIYTDIMTLRAMGESICDKMSWGIT